MNARLPEPPIGEDSVVRHEEELEVGTTTTPLGSVAVRKDVETHRVEDVVPVGTEHADVERVAPLEADSGEIETLPDGTISVPVFEEELVVTKRLRVRERILIRKATETHDETVTAEVRRERVEVVPTGEAEIREDDARPASAVDDRARRR